MRNESTLRKDGYDISNAEIKDVDLSMADHGVLTLEMTLEKVTDGALYMAVMS